jgi:hypothetical protein
MVKTKYLGFDDCLRICNDESEVIVATEFGPRILKYGPKDGPNLLGEFPNNQSTTEFGVWSVVGGHRLWLAPEAMPFSYAPDDYPVIVREEGKLSVRVTQKTDAAGFEKEMVVSLAPRGTELMVKHRITNRGKDPVDVAPWALTVFRDGAAVLPLEPFRSHDDALLPSQTIILWPFTDLADARITFQNRRIQALCNSSNDEPLKIGLVNKRGWAAYRSGSSCFVKTFPYFEGARYPDSGSNNEAYIAGDYLEIETLGPLAVLATGESSDHLETWRFAINMSDEDFEQTLQSLTTGPLR